MPCATQRCPLLNLPCARALPPACLLPPGVQEMQDALTSSEEEKNALKRQLAKLSKKYQQVGPPAGWQEPAPPQRPPREHHTSLLVRSLTLVPRPAPPCPALRVTQVTQQQAHAAGIVAGAAAALDAASPAESPEVALAAASRDEDSELEVGGGPAAPGMRQCSGCLAAWLGGGRAPSACARPLLPVGANCLRAAAAPSAAAQDAGGVPDADGARGDDQGVPAGAGLG